MAGSHRIGWLALVAIACGGVHPKPAPQTCDGSAANCERPYNKVTFAATHDAFAYATGGPVEYLQPNQDEPISDQLAYGIRTFGIRPCPSWSDDPSQKDVLYVTHNFSQLGGALGGEPLLDILTEIRVFLDAHPTEVVSLLEEDSVVTSAQVAAVFAQAGLAHYLYVHDPAKGWPTLHDMAVAGTRLVLFTDAPGVQPWQLPMWTYITDTDYNITDASQFSCDFYRGQPTNDLYFINQFIYEDYGGGIVTADPLKAQIANDPQTAYARAVSCWHQTGRIPNFIYVDFFLEGDVKSVVDQLNLLPR